MKVFFAALVFFLLAFAGLAAGLLLKRKGLRGGCTPAPGNDHECHCKGEKDRVGKEGVCGGPQSDEARKGVESRTVWPDGGACFPKGTDGEPKE